MKNEPLHRPSSPPPGRKTSDQAEEELRDKIALEVVKSMIATKGFESFMDECGPDAVIKGLPKFAYGMANEMIRARKEAK